MKKKNKNQHKQEQISPYTIVVEAVGGGWGGDGEAALATDQRTAPGIHKPPSTHCTREDSKANHSFLGLLLPLVERFKMM